MEIEKKILKFVWNHTCKQTPKILNGPSNTVKKKIKVGGITVANLKLYCKAMAPKQCNIGIKNRSIDK
jgi:hypothetical protein